MDGTSTVASLAGALLLCVYTHGACPPNFETLADNDPVRRTESAVEIYRALLLTTHEHQPLSEPERAALQTNPLHWPEDAANRAEPRELMRALATAVHDWEAPRRVELMTRLTEVVEDLGKAQKDRVRVRDEARDHVKASGHLIAPEIELHTDLNLRDLWFLPEENYLFTNEHTFARGLFGKPGDCRFCETGIRLHPDTQKGKYGLALNHARAQEPVRWINMKTLKPLSPQQYPFSADFLTSRTKSIERVSFTGNGNWMIVHFEGGLVETYSMKDGSKAKGARDVRKILPSRADAGTFWNFTNSETLSRHSPDGSAKPLGIASYELRYLSSLAEVPERNEIVLYSEQIHGFDAETGKSLWKVSIPWDKNENWMISAQSLTPDGNYFVRLAESWKSSRAEIFDARTGRRLAQGVLPGNFSKFAISSDTGRIALYGKGQYGSFQANTILVFDIQKWIGSTGFDWAVKEK